MLLIVNLKLNWKSVFITHQLVCRLSNDTDRSPSSSVLFSLLLLFFFSLTGAWLLSSVYTHYSRTLLRCNPSVLATCMVNMASLRDDTVIQELAPVGRRAHVTMARLRDATANDVSVSDLASNRRRTAWREWIGVVLRCVTVVHRDPQTVNAPRPPTDQVSAKYAHCLIIRR